MYVAPETAPSNFAVVTIMSSSIVFKWEPLSTGINGIVTSYEIICRNNANTAMVSKKIIYALVVKLHLSH